ncbi:PREDICTED: transcription initiation factor TFIID subunit 1 isoform X2 [Tarenaya hassleriana]|uniref:transcription initiation factor TFIID subunit 1 isoform X2 n=1 Tax=Tarenaya hassleriana TaxID=28532 RepID=UPI00053C86C0|nr:PREDICTED: transcription initiation factor TFIID subunit 1 isoform X2 [Tarenaya hassleriana]
MGESNSNGSYNNSSSDDDEENESRGFNLGFMFGNVDNSGDLDADYLDEDAKEHLSALADKLGTSLPNIEMLEKSEHTTDDTAEQDYDRKAEDAVDYEDIDEEYDGPEIQVVSEEDHLLPKKEYFAAEVSFASLKTKSSVFDEEDYDEEEESEVHDMVKRDFDTTEIEPDKPLESVELSKGETEEQADTEDVEKEVDDSVEGSLDDKSSAPLPTLYVEDGTVILRFSEIFAIQEPPQKRDKRERRYFTYRDKYKSMDISELVEDDDEVFLKSRNRIYSHAKPNDMILQDTSSPYREGPDLPRAGCCQSSTLIYRELTELRRDSCIMGEPLKGDVADDNLSSGESQLSEEVFPLDQQEWEQQILWETSPPVSCSSEENIAFSGVETEGVLVRGMKPVTEQDRLGSMNSKNDGQADRNMVLSFSANLLDSFGSRGPHPSSESLYESRYHPQLLRLESQWKKDDPSENDDVGGGNLEQLESGDLRRFSGLAMQERDKADEAWLDSIIWEPDKELRRAKLIFDLQDEQMVFEIPDNEDSKHLQLHAGAMIVSRPFKSMDGSLLEGCESNMSWDFNISNDKFYMNGKTSQQLQSNSNKGGVHSLRVFHSAPAIKLQTVKIKLSNKDISNFHRPKALWYPHDNELAIKQQGTLSSQGSMKIVVKSLGGKGSKLHVDREESVSSLKAKASKKLDFKPTETVKMFYLGKALEDDKCLAAQNVQPNSLVHLVRTKVHLWPQAQKLPGENKSLRPPGAFKKKSDLSIKDGHVFLMEYCEERPLLLSNAGMGANLCTYYQKSFSGDQSGQLLRNQSDTLGNIKILEPGEKSPFLGEMRAGCSQSSIETNMYRAPIFPHRVQSTDYLLVRSAKGKLSLRRIDRIAVVGQQEPLMEVMTPGSKNLQMYLVNRMLVYVYREFMKRGMRQPIAADELSFLFSNLSDAIIRKNMKACAVLKRDKSGQPCWFMRHDFHVPPENELKKMVAPEHVCVYESMLAGLYRLKHLGITRLTLPASISTAMTQLPDEAIALAAASHIERELQITPWNLSSNFVACKTQDRANIERLEITGVGDPSGRGLGFSYVRAAPKAPAAGGLTKKKAAASRGGSTVTGTDADLRRLSMEAAREVLLKFNFPDEIIAKQTRWHRIAMIRKLSSEQAASGIRVDSTTIGKYARGQRMSFLQLQQQAREKCQEIWDRQLQSLSAFDGDENESESEANSDLDSFAGDLENLLDAEECEDGEEATNMSKHARLDGVKGLKMRRRPQVETQEEIEDEAAEYAELCRLLMESDDQKKKKKKAKATGGVGSFPPSRPIINVQTVESLRKANVIDKKPIVFQSGPSFSGNENIVRDTTIVDSSIIRPPKIKQVKENGTPSLGQPKKVKILGDNLKVFKEKKSARENFVCGACGQHGHMRTNKHCPKYRENTESQHEDMDMEKSAGKPNVSDISGQTKTKPVKSKPASKSIMKVPLAEAPEGETSTSKTKGLPLRFRYGGPAGGGLVDIPVPEAPGSSDLAAASDLETVTKSASRISKIKISNKAKPEELQVESDRPSQSILPSVGRDRYLSESHKPSVSGQPLSSTEREQVIPSRLIPQPSMSTDRDQAESGRLHLVIRPPAEREQPQKKLVIKRSKEKFDHDWSSLEESPQFESRKTKRMADLAGYQRQESFRLAEDSLKRRPKVERAWWGEEEGAERHMEGRARRGYDDSAVSDEPEEIVEIRRYEEVIRREREEEERAKAKKKKKKKKLQPEVREEVYLDDYPSRRNDRRIAERGRSSRSRYVSELDRDGAEYAPQPKRRRKGEVGLSNILEGIVDTLRANQEVAYLFLKPVSRKEAPDYLDIVKRPMDLSTIREKVRRLEYKDREQFRHDVWQIKFNAHLYNDGRYPAIPPLADQLLEICDYLLDEYADDINEAEKGIDPND